MDDRLGTGIEQLDQLLDGGIPPGSVVALTADPASGSELILYELTAARGSLYLTADRDEVAVKDALASTVAPVGDPTVRDVSGPEPLETANRLFRALPQGANLIVDPVDPLERRDVDRYRTFLNDLRAHMANTGSIAVLHCLDGVDVPENRDTTEHMADVVFDLRTTVRGAHLDNRLAVPKFRGGRVPTDAIKLDLSGRVTVEATRDIA
ncbi:transcriptional regulator [Halobacteriales archaeon QS_8_69_26]|nr:MAG: transcriptional regulator [Halobacteriales archaeon QS_8_69_26]